MTKEQLEALGLNEEQIKEVFRLNGIAVNNAKGDYETIKTEKETLEGQLETANKEIESFKDLDIEGIKQAADDYKEKFEAAEKKSKEELEKIQFEHELENAIRDSEARNVTAVKALLDIEGLRGSKNRLEDIKKALEETKADNDYLFEVEDKQDGNPYFTRPTDKSKPVGITKEQFAAMGYMEKLELKQKDEGLYNKLRE